MNNDRTSVFVAAAPWTFERRTVDPRAGGGHDPSPSAPASNAGEQVVVKGGILLND